MTQRMREARMLVEAALAEGRPALVALLRSRLDVAVLRRIARQFGYSPKGGFRPERAPKDVLARGIADVAGPPMLEAIVEALSEVLAGEPAGGAGAAAAPEATLEAKLLLRDQQLRQLQDQVQRADAAAERARNKLADLQQQLEAAIRDLAQLKAENGELARRLSRAVATREADPAMLHRLHERERAAESFAQAEEQARRRLAEQAARIRSLESAVEELQELVPKGRRAKVRVEQPALADAFRLPRFTPRFYESLYDKDRRSIERAFQAALLFCVEGPSYPGLEVKQLEGGENLWSLRASLKLRVYFRLRSDGDVEFLALADREDQNTTIKRLREARG